MSRPNRRARLYVRAVAPVVLALLSLAVLSTGISVAYVRSGSPPSTQAADPNDPALLALAHGRQGSERLQVAGQPDAQPAVQVAPLGRLFLPDALVTIPQPPTDAQLARLRQVSLVQGFSVVSVGRTSFAGRPVSVLAVDPSSFRAFTPQPTAASDPLWQVVARGEAVASYELNQAGHLPLGQKLPLGSVPDERLGALAEFSLPNVDVVVNFAQAPKVAATQPALLVSAPTSDAPKLTGALGPIFGGAVQVTMLRPTFVPTVTSGGARLLPNSPTSLRDLYQRAAATCPGLPWTVLAAIGQVETNHGRNTAVSSAGAMGPMQFLPSTWAIYGVDADGDGKADINDQVDAVYSAARYLCAAGGGQPDTLYQAVYAYNHSDYYVRTVLQLASEYH